MLAFASIATVINALIRLCCFILLIPSWEGKMPIPERSKNSRGTSYPRGLERECLTWRCRIEKGRPFLGHQLHHGHLVPGGRSRLLGGAALGRQHQHRLTLFNAQLGQGRASKWTGSSW